MQIFFEIGFKEFEKVLTNTVEEEKEHKQIEDFKNNKSWQRNFLGDYNSLYDEIKEIDNISKSKTTNNYEEQQLLDKIDLIYFSPLNKEQWSEDFKKDYTEKIKNVLRTHIDMLANDKVGLFYLMEYGFEASEVANDITTGNY